MRSRFIGAWACIACAAGARADLLITEVLFAVPPGSAGDASGDGVRNATGDEFIEVVNTGRTPVSLGGHVLSSRLSDPGEDTGKGVRFEFPDVELAPRQVALVFSGYKTEVGGPVGSGFDPPAGPNPGFGGALVFSMGTASANRALRNSGDFVLLSGPSGELIDCIVWGDADPAPPRGVARLHEAPKRPKGSVHRVSSDQAPVDHEDLDGRLFSPGEVPG